MYKIDRRGGLGGVQKSFSRKLPNCIIRIEYNLDFNFLKFDIMKFVFQKFVFQECVFQEFVNAESLSNDFQKNYEIYFSLEIVCTFVP